MLVTTLYSLVQGFSGHACVRALGATGAWSMLCAMLVRCVNVSGAEGLCGVGWGGSRSNQRMMKGHFGLCQYWHSLRDK